MLYRMRTTLNVPADLLDEARHILGFQSKTDTVIVALRELIRLAKRVEIKTLYGKLDVAVDLDRSRRRQARG
jgi:hypothetical protein